MLKKIKSELAIGIIILLALAMIVFIWIMNNDLEKSAINFKGITTKNISATKDKYANSRVLFASHGQKNIYKVQTDDNKWIVIVDGQESAAYDSVFAPVFSDDGTQFAFGGTIDGQAVVVVNNEVRSQSSLYNDIRQIIFSSNGQSLAYVAIKESGSVIVVDGKESKTYQEIAPLETANGSAYIVFSPDGQQIAYRVVDSGGTYIVVNGQEGKRYDNISNFTFSADGTQFAYQAEINGQIITVVNNQEISSSSISSNNNSSNNTSQNNTNTTPHQSNYPGRGQDPDESSYFNQQLNVPICRKSTGCNF